MQPRLRDASLLGDAPGNSDSLEHQRKDGLEGGGEAQRQCAQCHGKRGASHANGKDCEAIGHRERVIGIAIGGGEGTRVRALAFERGETHSAP